MGITAKQLRMFRLAEAIPNGSEESRATVKFEAMAIEDGSANKNRNDILTWVSIGIGIAGVIMSGLPYVVPPDPANPIRFHFLLRTVSIPLWGTILAVLAIASGAFQLGVRARLKKRFGTSLSEKETLSQKIDGTRRIQKPVESNLRLASLASSKDGNGITLKMPDHYDVRICQKEESEIKALFVSVDNNRLETIGKVRITIYGAQSFDATHGQFRDGSGFQAGIIAQHDNILPSTTGKADLFVRKDPGIPHLLAFNDSVHPLPWPTNDKSQIQRWRLSLGVTASTVPLNSAAQAVQFGTEKLFLILRWDSLANEFALEVERP